MNSSVTPNLIYDYLTTGASQSDLTVLQALRVAMTDVCSKPYLLNYVFQDLLHDNLSTKFGNKELSKIKQFFSTYKIPIVYGAFLMTKESPPFVAVRLMQDNENESLKGLGEQNAMTDFEDTETISSKDVYSQPYVLYGPFSPQYDSATGIMTLPSGFDTSQIFVNECIQSATGKLYPVLTLINSTSFTIATGISDNFTNAAVVFQNPDPHLFYNFFFFDQVFEITCVTGADSAPLFWLTSLIKWILLRYRKDLLEKYNVGLTSLSMGPSDLLEVQDTNVQLLVQKFTMKARVEQRVLVDISSDVRGIKGAIGIQSIGDPDFTLTEEIE